jgi:transcription termination/antitermination protein NusA
MSDATASDPEQDRRGSGHTEAGFEAKRRELGVADELKSIPGITTLMLVAFGMQGIKSIEDLAGCASDDLYGWIEEKSGNVTRHSGILDRFAVSRSECDAIILHARFKAGWLD